MLRPMVRFASVLLALSLYFSSAEARYTPVLFGWGGETIIKVVDFPNTSQFKWRGATFIDAGAIYKTFTVFFVPLWNYDVRWVGYIGKSDEYLEFTRAELEELASYSDTKLPQSPSLPFWDSYGGKLVILLVVFIGILTIAANSENKRQ